MRFFLCAKCIAEVIEEKSCNLQSIEDKFMG